MVAAQKLAPQVGRTRACASLGVSRMSEFRQRKPMTCQKKQLKLHPRALLPDETAEVLRFLGSDAHVDQAPAAVYAQLLDQGQYLCSVSTMYRILRAKKAIRERRDLRRHPIYQAPELVAQRPNEVWSWDLTKLKGHTKFEYFHLYVMLDIYSRRVVGWMVAERESGTLAATFIQDCCAREHVTPGSLTIHSDRGTAMMSKPVSGLLSSLDVHKTVSRPQVSNDNPFIESHFKTMKYRPSFPKRFGSVQDVRANLTPFFVWYNSQHRHSGIGHFTPDQVHSGQAAALQAAQRLVLKQAYDRHPKRFVRGLPSPRPLPTAVWINPPQNGLPSDFEPSTTETLTHRVA